MKRTGDLRRTAATAMSTALAGLLALSITVLATPQAQTAPAPVVAAPVVAAPVVAAPLVAAPVVATPVADLADESRGTARVDEPAKLPFGKGPIYPGHMLVAYYGTAGTGALGVLGEGTPDNVTKRLRRAAEPFGTRKKPVQIVYELIVTIADAVPGSDGDYSHDIARSKVEDFIEAAHRNKALLVLDLQPGRSNFLDVAKRWKWALRDPYVGLALDPEWRMGQGQVPAQVIGSVHAKEVNSVSKWLSGLSRRKNLPQKVFMLHSFRTTMIRRIKDVVRRDRLATVLHIDGFGTPSQKLATYHTVAATRPKHMRMGFKLFYDEDQPRMTARQVKRIRPEVDFVSFQ